ncbi:hypothetical protein ACFVYA_16010 [Amycolatopsis sp. NPDC058278]|uniref:hypothetical protein n=1 Tax=Amycolatopsis sp. NPDC058278 TaxID=3346417 RepID=UPI0036D97127
MESALDDLYDEYPVGWVLTYRCRRTPGPPFGGCAAGVVLGPPVRDAGTGLESIPLAPLGDGPTVWVPDRDVVGIEPRWAPAGGVAAGGSPSTKDS